MLFTSDSYQAGPLWGLQLQLPLWNLLQQLAPATCQADSKHLSAFSQSSWPTRRDVRVIR